SHDGSVHTWHLLDTGPPAEPEGPTIVCVHGNPTWAYAWKPFLTRLSDRHRVVAVDQLGMGYSGRGLSRQYAERVLDLADLITALDLASSPIVLAAHDWGGAVAMGWAVDHSDRVAGMVLCNTGIAVPDGRGAPKIIRLAASGALRDLVCRRTNGFVEGTVRLSGSRIGRVDREAFRAPYRHREHRQAIADFVGDVPLSSPHPSEAALASVSDRLHTIEAPVLLAWGARDIVFDDDFSSDLAGKFPNTVTHRFADANHLVMAETDVASVVDDWLHTLAPRASSAASTPPDSESSGAETAVSGVFDGLERRRRDDTVAIADLATRTMIDFATFVRRVDGAAAELTKRGLTPGDRVAMLTPPGIDLLIAVYAVWRAGGVTVVADRGLGLRGLGAAVASTRPSWTVGPKAAHLASTTMRWAPRATHIDVADLMSSSDEPPVVDPSPWPSPSDPAAVLFTSGATGPAKGVRYTHGQLAAQRDALGRAYGITDDDRLVAAFAPFAIYGPSLGVPTAFTDCDVTTPGDLTASALDDACAEIDATMAFASPAALTNVVATASDVTPGIEGLRLVFSAGAPVPAETLTDVRKLAPRASIHTPYGMTEALPVADIDLDEILDAESGGAAPRGVCVGRPVDGADVRIAPFGFDALGGVPDSVGTNVTGEILVRAPWVSDGYLDRWQIERAARPGDGWHRSGDVGHLDDLGRLWVEGRAVHVIHTVDGAVTPVPIERAVERALVPQGLATAGRVAAVGIGAGSCQQVVVVIEQAHVRAGLADPERSRAARSAAGRDIAAVLVTDALPVDIRHNAKIDRVAVGTWAGALLEGEAPAVPLSARIRHTSKRRRP
ncbi:MAG: alpha/beta fold hydrolase, partial [Ilumatobacter sp.]